MAGPLHRSGSILGLRLGTSAAPPSHSRVCCQPATGHARRQVPALPPQVPPPRRATLAALPAMPLRRRSKFAFSEHRFDLFGSKKRVSVCKLASELVREREERERERSSESESERLECAECTAICSTQPEGTAVRARIAFSTARVHCYPAVNADAIGERPGFATPRAADATRAATTDSDTRAIAATTRAAATAWCSSCRYQPPAATSAAAATIARPISAGATTWCLFTHRKLLHQPQGVLQQLPGASSTSASGCGIMATATCFRHSCQCANSRNLN